MPTTISGSAGVETSNVLATGNVGIGTDTPTQKLVVAQTSTDGCWLFGSGVNSYLGLGGFSGSTFGAFRLNYDRSSGDITFNGGSRDTPVERLRITGNSGLVGIGTPFPNQALTVNGSISATGQVFTPARPAFCAHTTQLRNFNAYVTGNTSAIATWDTKSLDVSNNFSTTTGRFTAPVTGTYWFSVTMAHNPQNTTADFGDIFISKNGSMYGAPIVFRSQTFWESGNISLAMFLSASEWASVGVSAYTGNSGQFYMTFSGYLIG